MKEVSLSEAKVRPGELIDRAASGEPVVITRRGKPVAQLAAVEPARKRITASALRAVTDAMPRQRDSARVLARRMRDEERL